MAFDESVQRLARLRATGVCECTSQTCPHFGRCRAKGTEFHHKRALVAGGDDDLRNCQLLCKACHDRIHQAGGVGRV